MSYWDAVDHFFPVRLQEALDRKGIDGKDLEDMGIISQASIKEYFESGRLPNLRTACRLAEFLDVDLGWLCGCGETITRQDLTFGIDRRAPWLKE